MPEQITPEMIRESSQRIMNALMKRTKGMHDLDRIFRVYNEAIDDAASFVEVMARENPQHQWPFEMLARKMRKELPLMREEN